MLFNYIKTLNYMDSIDIDDIGNCCIQAFNDYGLEWILKIETKLGWSTTKIFDPFEADKNKMSDNFMYVKSSTEFNHKRIYKKIDDFINDPKKEITQLLLIEDDNYLEKLNNIVL